MQSNITFPAHRWPYSPSWELDGFDFSVMPVAQYRTAVSGFLSREFTTGITSRRPSEADYCRIVANNVAAQFRAMLYCTDCYPSPAFWQRVQECSLGHNIPSVQRIKDLFLHARKAYLRNTGGCPNEAARLVDEWIACMDSIHAATGSAAHMQPSADTQVPWNVRLKEWKAMRVRGGLMDAGVPIAQPAAATGHASFPHTGGQYHLMGAPSASGYLPAHIPIKQEDVSDNPSAMNLGPSEPGRPDPKGKRKRNQRSATPSPRPSKRHANGVYTGNEQTHQQLQMPEPFLGGFQEGHHDEFALVAQAEHESSPAVENQSALTSVENGSGHRSTKARVTACEEKLAEHLNLIHEQDSKLSTQEDLVANHTTNIENLESRVKSIEENSSAGKEVKTTEESVVELMNRLSSKQDQTRIDTRLDGFSKELAAEKVRGDNLGTVVAKQKRLMKKRLKAQKLHTGQIEDLCNRVTELEGKLTADKESSDSEDETTALTTAPLAQEQLADLTGRIAQLEKKVKAQNKKRKSSADKILNRLSALEAEHAKLKKDTEERHSALERRVGEQGNRLARQDQPAGSRRSEIVPAVRAQIQTLPPRPTQAAYNHGYHQSQHRQYHPHGSR